MGDKETFPQRLEKLNLNVDALKGAVVCGWPDGFGGIDIPNVEGKRGSLQVYAEITTNDSYIGPEQARRGLEIFGEELRQEAARDKDRHPSITLLEDVVRNGLKLRAHIVRRESAKPLPLSSQRLSQIAEEFGTPFHIYDEAGIRCTAQGLYSAFSWAPGFDNFFAVKALPNPHILKVLQSEGMGADCSSLPELMIAKGVGLSGSKMIFTSNDTPANEFRFAKELGAIINFDDLTHIGFFERYVGALPNLVCCRYNPGNAKEGNSIIGVPEEAKYGFTRNQLSQGFRELRDKGVKRFGLHTMVASNELNPQYFVETAQILFNAVRELSTELGINFEFVNLGGGIGTPYKPEQRPVDLNKVSQGIKEAYQRIILGRGLPSLNIFMENGRMVTGPHGWLVSRVEHVASKYKIDVGLDVSMQGLMRPAMYGAYHHITVLGMEDAEPYMVCDVTGSLCEGNDRFAINRFLPHVEEGDLVAIHNTGAHGHAMGFNYNGKLRPQELLLRSDGSVQRIRRAETPHDYFATLDFPGTEFTSSGLINSHRQGSD